MSPMFEKNNDLESFEERSARLERHARWITASHVHNQRVLKNDYVRSDERLAKGKIVIFKREKLSSQCIVMLIYSARYISRRRRLWIDPISSSSKKKQSRHRHCSRSTPPRNTSSIRVAFIFSRLAAPDRFPAGSFVQFARLGENYSDTHRENQCRHTYSNVDDPRTRLQADSGQNFLQNA